MRIFEDRIEVRYAGKVQLACERLRGRNLHRIDYRHVIWSLVRKPGGFARYVYREELFPSVTLRAELVDHEQHATRAAGAASIDDYIANFYNIERRHSYLGYLNPIEFELRAMTAKAAA